MAFGQGKMALQDRPGLVGADGTDRVKISNKVLKSIRRSIPSTF